MQRARTGAIRSKLAWTLVLLACACADDFPLPSSDAPANSVATLKSERFEMSASVEPAEPEHTVALVDPEPPPPRRLEPGELAQLLTTAEQHLRELDIKARPRHSARGPLPDASELRLAYAEGRAFVLEGRFDQVRDWAALAKFGSPEPGPYCELSPLSRYDLIVTRHAREQTAYLHVIVPPHGLAKPGARGRHEAWIEDQRWINLADVIEPERDYLPFKSNGKESLHRQWARADVVESLVAIAGEYRQRTGLPLGIGDLSHVTGGKIEDHWTHQQGVDVDVYLLDPADVDPKGRPRVWWNYVKRGVSRWTSQENGKGEREPALDPSDELSHTPTSRRLEILAQIVFAIDDIAYFVHNDPVVLAPFDEQVGERRAGRRFLHAKNRGYWPTHADHVHLRWVEGELPVGVTPRP
ncbi:MAG TPA: penicillin-insensitive murein endopeptidase [Enhygromyxa sp.]|nr:penicillin-insensitive murein endopeptidase [Enhygromyxa sp.]